MKKLLILTILVMFSISFASALIFDNSNIAYYKFDDNNLSDSTDNNWDGINQGTVNASGIIIDGRDFGGNDYINTTIKEKFVNSISINTWVKPEQVNRSDIFGVYIDGNNLFALDLGRNDNANFRTQLGTTDNSSAIIAYDINASIGSWYMVTSTYEDGNLSMYINGNLLATEYFTGTFDVSGRAIVIGGSNDGSPATYAFDGIIDEVGVWNRSLTAAEVVSLYNSGNGLPYTREAVCNFEYNSVNQSIDCEGNPTITSNNTMYNYKKAGDIVYLNYTSGAAYSVPITLVANQNFGKVYFTNTTTNVTTVQHYGWNYKIFEINQTYNTLTTEGANEQFSINLTKASTLQVSAVYLVYNGTSNLISYMTSGNDVYASGTITIPTATSDVNVSFYWNIMLSDGSNINTDSNNQTIQKINIDDCSAYSNLIYNYTLYDEGNQTKIDDGTTIEVQINIYDLSKELLLINFSQKYEDVNPAQVCLESPLLTTVNYSAYTVVKYFANSTTTNESYSIEYYNTLNETIGNTTVPKNINLYGLKVEDTTKFRLTFRDISYSLAPNILVNVYRQYVSDNDFKIVEIPLTDNNGQTILNLVRNDVVYNFIMINESGDIVGTFNSVTAFCQDFTIGECTINLAPDAPFSESYDYNEEFDISISTPQYDSSQGIVSVDFVTGDLTPKKVTMNIFRNNDFGNRSVCSNSLTASSGTINCNVSEITETDQFLFIYIYVDGSLARQNQINLNASNLRFGILNGAFYGFLIMLFMVCLFMDDRMVLTVSLGIGWILIISLGLINGKIFGFGSAGIWLLVSIIIFIWKLSQEENT